MEEDLELSANDVNWLRIKIGSHLVYQKSLHTDLLKYLKVQSCLSVILRTRQLESIRKFNCTFHLPRITRKFFRKGHFDLFLLVHKSFFFVTFHLFLLCWLWEQKKLNWKALALMEVRRENCPNEKWRKKSSLTITISPKMVFHLSAFIATRFLFTRSLISTN